LPEDTNQQPTAPRVSAIVTSHNRAALLRRCLEALEKCEERERMQIIVVDNGSTDGSAQLEAAFPEVRFMRLPRNFGLTKALNIGIRGAEADYLFLLHEDTEPAPDAARLLADELDRNTEAGAVCPLLVNAAERPAPQVDDFPPSGVFQPVAAASDPVPVNYALGAALMFRSFFFKAMRKVDERYGQFGSDAELCYKIRTAGKKILVLPNAKVAHHGREETSALRQADFRLGVAVFLAKHRGFAGGLKARLGAVFSALGGFRFGELAALVSGQKIDGTQG
jgi:GT2 family glycosyltransferase